MINLQDIAKRLYRSFPPAGPEAVADWAGASIHVECEVLDLHNKDMETGSVTTNHLIIFDPQETWAFVATEEMWSDYTLTDDTIKFIYSGQIIKGNVEDFESWLILFKLKTGF